MRIKNKVGCDEFDEMTKNLKSFPEENSKTIDATVNKNIYKQRVNQLFGFTMKRFKCANNLKPILGARTLSIAAESKEHENTNSKFKRNQSRGGSVSGSKIHKAYSNKIIGHPKTSQPQTARKLSQVEAIQEAKGIFITTTNDENEREEVNQNVTISPKDMTPTVHLQGEPSKPTVK